MLNFGTFCVSNTFFLSKLANKILHIIRENGSICIYIYIYIYVCMCVWYHMGLGKELRPCLG